MRIGRLFRLPSLSSLFTLVITVLVGPACFRATDALFNTLAPFTVNTPSTAALLGVSVGPPSAEALRERIQLPPGFEISIYAELRYPRTLLLTETGDLLVTQPRENRVLLLERDRDGDGQPDGVRLLIERLSFLSGLALRDGWIYFGQAERITRARYDEEAGLVTSPLDLVVELPRTQHWNRTLHFGPEGWLYVGVGADCNICEDEDPRGAAMLRMQPDGRAVEVFATGIRNSSAYDWHPESGAMFAVDAGRDHLGDDLPPEELNRIERGGFYGYPYVHGAGIVDPDFGDLLPADSPPARAPSLGFGAHTTPLGFTFLRGEWERFRGMALVAFHGSWNRTKKQGYEVLAVEFDPSGEVVGVEDFATGFLEDEEVIGRPVDIVEGPGPALYLSDDYAGAIYRITPGPVEPSVVSRRSPQ